MKLKPDHITLFFDYDGTLHDCIRIYAPAFRKVYQELVAAGITQPKQYLDQDISPWLGLPAQEMWEQFLPELAQAQKDYYGMRIGAEMFHLVSSGCAALYPGTEDTLHALREQGYRLIFLSNCQRGYMEVHRRTFHLTKYFSNFFCAEDFPGKAKWEIYQSVRHRFPGQHVMIGDRQKDMEIAQRFNLPAIGCTYGYGTPDELKTASHLISDVTALKTELGLMLHN